MGVLILAVPGIALLGVGVIAFRRFWPSAPESSTSSSTALLGAGGRQFTTGQIARRVFWGMWLFTISQMILGGTIALVVLLLGGAFLRSAGL